MKLFIILSVIACSYGDKLDRTYLPPANAGIAGGSPGSIAAPGTETKLGIPKDTSLGQPSGSSFEQPSGSSLRQPSGSSFGQQTSGSSFGQPSGSSFGLQPSSSFFGQPSGSSFSQQPLDSTSGNPSGSSDGQQPSESSFGQLSGSSFGQQPSGSSFGQPSGSSFGQQPSGSSFGQPSVSSDGQQPSGSSFGQPAGSSFGQKYPDSSLGQSSDSSFGQPTSSSFGQQPSGSLSTKPSGSLISKPTSSSFGQPSFTSSNQQSGSNLGQEPNQTEPQLGQPAGDLIDSQYNQGGPSDGAGRPGFGQTSNGFNNSPALNANSQRPATYNGLVQPERSRASIDRNAEILHYENNNDGDKFAYSFETSNGIAANEAGVATNGVQAEGGYSYTGDDGQYYSIRYTADKNGYIPQGDHLPTPHPIPEEILKSLEENARAAAAGTQEGAYNPDEDSDSYNGANYPGQGQPGQISNKYLTDQGSPYGNQGSSSAIQSQGVQEFASGNDAPTTSFGNLGTAPSQNEALAVSLSSSKKPGTSRFPSQNNQLPGYQYRKDSTSDGNKYPSSQNSAPEPTATDAKPGSQDSQVISSPYSDNQNAPLSGTTNSLRPSLSSQGTKSSTYGSPTSTTSNDGQDSRRPGFQTTSRDRPTVSTQYGVPEPSSSFNRPGSLGFSQNIPSYASPSGARPGFPTQTGQPSDRQFDISNDSTFGSKKPFESQGVLPQSSTNPKSQLGFSSVSGDDSDSNRPVFSSNGNKYNTLESSSSGYKYKAPLAASREKKPGSQRLPYQDTSSPASQYDRYTGTSKNSNELSEPQRINFSSSSGPEASRPYSIQSPTSQYTSPGSSNFGSLKPIEQQRYPSAQSQPQYNAQDASSLDSTRPGSQEFTQYNTSAGSPFGATMNSGSQNSPSKAPARLGASPSNGNQSPTSSYNTPGLTTFGSKKPTESPGFLRGQYRPVFNQRPQFGSPSLPGSTKPTLSVLNGQNTQEQDNSGYKYSRPQNQFIGQQASKFSNVPGSRFSSSAPTGSSRPYDQSTNFGNGLSRDETNLQDPTSGAPRGNYNYPSGSSPGPSNVSSNQKFPGSVQDYPSGSGQYNPTRVDSRPTDSIFNRPSNAIGSFGITPQYQLDHSSGSQSSMADSVPYQYKRPESQESRPVQSSFGPSGQNRPGQAGSQPSFGPSRQETPQQINSQPNLGFSGPGKDGKLGSQPGFGSLGENSPVQAGSPSTFGLTEQDRNHQAGINLGYGNVSQDRPGQTQSSFGPSRQNQFGQIESLSASGPSSQGSSNQDESQTGVGTIGQNVFNNMGTNVGDLTPKRPGPIGSQSLLGSSGQNRPGQTGSRPGFGTSNQNRPGQLGNGKPTETFGGPRQPPSFTPEEGYKY